MPHGIPFQKRLFDLLCASLGLLALSPFLLILALVVASALGRPVLFRQPRLGYRGKPFSVIKFRSMTDRRATDGSLLPDAERLTRLGSFLRATSLDELPELINVLRGEMSLVGPRPLITRYRDLYSAEQMRRHDVLPGITGWAQVNGRNAITWVEKFHLDVWYVENWSFWLDMRILWLTIWKTVRREGISQAGQATMEEFNGSN